MTSPAKRTSPSSGARTAPGAGSAAVAPILLFDGGCNLCRSSVRFILRHERAPMLRFGSLQSPQGRALLVAHGLPADHERSLVLLADGRALTGSDAALAVAGQLRRPWSWAQGLRVLPRSWRERLYEAVALRRQRWFGRCELGSAVMPTGQTDDRFLD